MIGTIVGYETVGTVTVQVEQGTGPDKTYIGHALLLEETSQKTYVCLVSGSSREEVSQALGPHLDDLAEVAREFGVTDPVFRTLRYGP